MGSCQNGSTRFNTNNKLNHFGLMVGLVSQYEMNLFIHYVHKIIILNTNQQKIVSCSSVVYCHLNLDYKK